ncbi:pantoate--beta-alanine ligase [Acidaminobacter hydrogenoformans]|uniref:Pantothenate synthetase n=1 Tax=Acidaminobacter hydrogenoformans DSM 2784 TaxID=1120920 RepID=A0A1G5S2T4_9FIRM|nr:pantoate--beta-alanine ligase [Acidaminobacter hydrogenoformans]SCZ80702.1 pantoate--beta-alanine ligase [Acidaminobacter hydrogenoformans DSM 2784]
MEVDQNPRVLQQKLKALKKTGKSVGLVPTMGFLHEGHLSLVRQARRENDVVAVSIFVNPIQFGPKEDLASYPRDFERDAALLEAEGVDFIFAPEVADMYPEGYGTYVDVEGEVTGRLCGASRPGHFRGVATVVSKLFNIVAPERAYFGSKDAQQVAVIRRMASDLNFDFEIVACPIVREADGLALSSRNVYLSESKRQDALVLSQSLFMAREMIEAGERSAFAVRDAISERIRQVPSAEVDYIEVVDAFSLEPLETLSGTVLIALAVKVGKPRLIDNLQIEVK